MFYFAFQAQQHHREKCADPPDDQHTEHDDIRPRKLPAHQDHITEAESAASISAATSVVQDTPIAIRTPAKIICTEDGRPTCQKIFQLLAPYVFATLMRVRFVSWMPVYALMTHGIKPPKKIMNAFALNPMPKSMIVIGIHATEEWDG